MPLGVGGVAMRRRSASAAVPFSINVLVNHNDADGWESKSTGAVDLDDTTLAINGSRIMGFYFEDESLVLPVGSVIESAFVRFKATANASPTNVTTCFVQKSVTPVIFTTATDDMSDRPWTTANAEWSIPNWTSNQVDSGTETPSLVTLFQEVVDAGGIDGSAAVFLRGDSSTGNHSLYPHDSVSGSSVPPRLIITGTTPG